MLPVTRRFLAVLLAVAVTTTVRVIEVQNGTVMLLGATCSETFGFSSVKRTSTSLDAGVLADAVPSWLPIDHQTLAVLVSWLQAFTVPVT